MGITLYDLRLADEAVRPSPPCWLVKFVLLHKGLDFSTAPLGFSDKTAYPDPDYGRLPVLRDGPRLVRDSLAIVDHLETAYPQRPLAAEETRAFVEYHRAHIGARLFPFMARGLALAIHDAALPEDRAYFRASREQRFGETLEAAAARDYAAPIGEACAVLAAPLQRRAYYAGDRPGLLDYDVASVFLWERAVRPSPLADKPAPLAQWFERMLDLFDGYARRAPRV